MKLYFSLLFAAAFSLIEISANENFSHRGGDLGEDQGAISTVGLDNPINAATPVVTDVQKSAAEEETRMIASVDELIVTKDGVADEEQDDIPFSNLRGGSPAESHRGLASDTCSGDSYDHIRYQGMKCTFAKEYFDLGYNHAGMSITIIDKECIWDGWTWNTFEADPNNWPTRERRPATWQNFHHNYGHPTKKCFEFNGYFGAQHFSREKGDSRHHFCWKRGGINMMACWVATGQAGNSDILHRMGDPARGDCVIEDWEPDEDGDTYELETYHGTFVRGLPYGGVDGASVSSTWEQWELLKIGSHYAIKNKEHGTFLSARDDGSVALVDNGGYAWEKWDLIEQGDKFQIKSVAHGGKFLRVHPGDGGVADLADVGDIWELFKLAKI